MPAPTTHTPRRALAGFPHLPKPAAELRVLARGHRGEGLLAGRLHGSWRVHRRVRAHVVTNIAARSGAPRSLLQRGGQRARTDPDPRRSPPPPPRRGVSRWKTTPERARSSAARAAPRARRCAEADAVSALRGHGAIGRDGGWRHVPLDHRSGREEARVPTRTKGATATPPPATTEISEHHVPREERGVGELDPIPEHAVVRDVDARHEEHPLPMRESPALRRESLGVPLTCSRKTLPSPISSRVGCPPYVRSMRDRRR